MFFNLNDAISTDFRFIQLKPMQNNICLRKLKQAIMKKNHFIKRDKTAATTTTNQPQCNGKMVQFTWDDCEKIIIKMGEQMWRGKI